MNVKFNDVAEEVFLESQKALLKKLKGTSGGNASGSGGDGDSIKKEAVSAVLR